MKAIDVSVPRIIQSLIFYLFQIDPEDFESNFNLGILYFTDTPTNKKDHQKAIHYLKIAIADEKSATAMFNLAVIYEEVGDRVRAKEMYQEVSIFKKV